MITHGNGNGIGTVVQVLLRFLFKLESEMRANQAKHSMYIYVNIR